MDSAVSARADTDSIALFQSSIPFIAAQAVLLGRLMSPGAAQFWTPTLRQLALWIVLKMEHFALPQLSDYCSLVDICEHPFTDG